MTSKDRRVKRFVFLQILLNEIYHEVNSKHFILIIQKKELLFTKGQQMSCFYKNKSLAFDFISHLPRYVHNIFIILRPELRGDFCEYEKQDMIVCKGKLAFRNGDRSQ